MTTNDLLSITTRKNPNENSPYLSGTQRHIDIETTYLWNVRSAQYPIKRKETLGMRLVIFIHPGNEVCNPGISTGLLVIVLNHVYAWLAAKKCSEEALCCAVFSSYFKMM